jgi:hypothetical protein
MIKITSFNPFQNFLRITQEFHEDKAIVRLKSLSTERTTEFSYEEVGEIRDGFYTANSQRTFGFFTILFSNMVLVIFCNWLTSQPAWYLIPKITLISGVFLYISSYLKKWHIVIVNKKGITLSYLQRNNFSSNILVEEALEKIKSKSKNIDELTTAAPFLNVRPAFKHNYFSFSNLEKTVDFFYEDEIIGLQKGVFGEEAYKVKYSNLSGEVYNGKESDGLQWHIFEWGFLSLSIISGLEYGFGVQTGINSLYFLLITGMLITAAWIVSLRKQDVVGFYNETGQIEYWAFLNRSDKENFEKIIEYVKSKIPVEAVVKEQ